MNEVALLCKFAISVLENLPWTFIFTGVYILISESNLILFSIFDVFDFTFLSKAWVNFSLIFNQNSFVLITKVFSCNSKDLEWITILIARELLFMSFEQ